MITQQIKLAACIIAAVVTTAVQAQGEESADVLGTKKWGAGPTAVVLKQTGPWTYGMLANHIWSFAGDSDRGYVNATFLQPFLSYTTKQAWTYSLNTESTRNWETNEDEWTIPLNVQATKVLKIGGSWSA